MNNIATTNDAQRIQNTSCNDVPEHWFVKMSAEQFGDRHSCRIRVLNTRTEPGYGAVKTTWQAFF